MYSTPPPTLCDGRGFICCSNQCLFIRFYNLSPPPTLCDGPGLIFNLHLKKSTTYTEWWFRRKEGVITFRKYKTTLCLVFVQEQNCLLGPSNLFSFLPLFFTQIQYTHYFVYVYYYVPGSWVPRSTTKVRKYHRLFEKNASWNSRAGFRTGDPWLTSRRR